MRKVDFSATDADSMTPKGHREEGWFFTWTPAELELTLGPNRLKTLRTVYGITDRGDLRQEYSVSSTPVHGLSSNAWAIQDAVDSLRKSTRSYMPLVPNDHLPCWMTRS